MTPAERKKFLATPMRLLGQQPQSERLEYIKLMEITMSPWDIEDLWLEVRANHILEPEQEAILETYRWPEAEAEAENIRALMATVFDALGLRDHGIYL